MVPEAGVEPTTFGLEGHCSSTELLRQKFFIFLCFLYLKLESWQLPTLTHLRDALPSELTGLTSVFGMGTGVPQPL